MNSADGSRRNESGFAQSYEQRQQKPSQVGYDRDGYGDPNEVPTGCMTFGYGSTAGVYDDKDPSPRTSDHFRFVKEKDSQSPLHTAY